MTMTRKDYTKFAEALGQIRGVELSCATGQEAPTIINTLNSVTSYIGHIFQEDNPNFDWDKFEAAIEQEFDEALDRLP